MPATFGSALFLLPPCSESSRAGVSSHAGRGGEGSSEWGQEVWLSLAFGMNLAQMFLLSRPILISSPDVTQQGQEPRKLRMPGGKGREGILPPPTTLTWHQSLQNQPS